VSAGSSGTHTTQSRPSLTPDRTPARRCHRMVLGEQPRTVAASTTECVWGGIYALPSLPLFILVSALVSASGHCPAGRPCRPLAAHRQTVPSVLLDRATPARATTVLRVLAWGVTAWCSTMGHHMTTRCPTTALGISACKSAAARVTSTSRQTIYRALEAGRLTWEPDGTIETAELLRAGFSLQAALPPEAHKRQDKL